MSRRVVRILIPSKVDTSLLSQPQLRTELLYTPPDNLSKAIMSVSPDSREGLSPPPANILDIFTGDEDSDDVDSYHPTEEQSTDASGLGEEDSDIDFAGKTSRNTHGRIIA